MLPEIISAQISLPSKDSPVGYIYLYEYWDLYIFELCKSALSRVVIAAAIMLFAYYRFNFDSELHDVSSGIFATGFVYGVLELISLYIRVRSMQSRLKQINAEKKETIIDDLEIDDLE
jgi:hypothetical protein